MYRHTVTYSLHIQWNGFNRKHQPWCDLSLWSCCSVICIEMLPSTVHMWQKMSAAVICSMQWNGARYAARA